MEPRQIRVGDFSDILGASTENSEYTCIASVLRQRTACGKIPKAYSMSNDFYLNCPDCLTEIQYRYDHPEACKDDFGFVHTIKEEK